MKKIILLLLLFVVTTCTAVDHDAVLHLSFSNIKSPECFVWMPVEVKNSSQFISLQPGKTAQHTFRLAKPGFVDLFMSEGDRYFSYILYLSPGDNIELKGDLKKPNFGITVTGKGSNNNQPLMAFVDETQLKGLYKDTLPGRAINKLNAEQRLRENNLQKYIDLYKPSEDYVKAWKTDLPYIIAYDFYIFKEVNKYSVRDNYWRNYNSWQKVTDSLFTTAKLDNADALGSVHYARLVREFLLRERETLLYRAQSEPQKFFKEWYNTDTLTGQKLLKEDNLNILHEKTIEKYLSGKPAEFAYGALFEYAGRESAAQNIPEIFERFKSKYPHSDYIPLFAPSVDVIIAKRRQVLNDKMVFMADNGLKFNTLEEVLGAMKGKTVLVDMWGTWCGPCRQEIEKHSASIHEHFKGKNLNYLYIANYDLKNGEQWKKLIAYHNIEGMHMMANDNLTNDIMTKLKSTGYPTLFIIKKDGTFERSKTDYPINRDILFKQLEEDLAQ